MKTKIVLDKNLALYFSKFPLKNLLKEYPNSLMHVMSNEDEKVSPKNLHPTFYGCYDWHSSVHNHWLLIRLLKLFPALDNATEIVDTINKTITEENISVEIKYFDNSDRKSFERPYGWAWLLKLIEELIIWNNPIGNKWLETLKPLTKVIIKRFFDFLPTMKFPIRRGIHDNTAFGLILALDYCRTANNKDLEKLIEEHSLKYYMQDKSAPLFWEPGGDDFLSPSLIETELMRKILDNNKFKLWFECFMPGFTKGYPEHLFTPISSFDRSDPKFTHLDGLNFSRSWCFFNLSKAFKYDKSIYNLFYKTGISHFNKAIKNISTGGYGGEHWLPSFAVYSFECKETCEMI